MVYIITGIVLGIILIYLIICFLFTWKMHSAIFGKRMDVNPLVKYYTKEQFGLKSREYNIDMDGVKLNGNLYYYDNYKKDAVVIFSHGMNAPTKAYLQEIEYIARAGFIVLGYDYYGHDESEGKCIKGFSMGLKSLDYAVSKVLSDEEFKNSSIYLAGHSWGAYNSIAELSIRKGKIKAVAVFSPFRTMEGAVFSLKPKAGILIPFIRLVEFMKCGKYAFYNAKRGIKEKVPVLIFHSEDDPMVSYSKNALYFNKKNNVKLITVKNRKHNPEYTEEAVRKLYAFYARAGSLKGEELEAYMKSVNYNELGAIDEDIMSQATAFLK